MPARLKLNICIWVFNMFNRVGNAPRVLHGRAVLRTIRLRSEIYL